MLKIVWDNPLPFESGEIVIARARQQITYPARFQLVAAMNPCPCGYYGDLEHSCSCNADTIRRYQNRISGPLLDRIDLQVPVTRLPKGVLSGAHVALDDSTALRENILRARDKQLQRQQKVNAHLSGVEVDAFGRVSVENRTMLEEDVLKLGLSARAYYRILKVARTIADLEDSSTVEKLHIREALYYRALDRKPS